MVPDYLEWYLIIQNSAALCRKYELVQSSYFLQVFLPYQVAKMFVSQRSNIFDVFKNSPNYIFHILKNVLEFFVILITTA